MRDTDKILKKLPIEFPNNLKPSFSSRKEFGDIPVGMRARRSLTVHNLQEFWLIFLPCRSRFMAVNP